MSVSAARFTLFGNGRGLRTAPPPDQLLAREAFADFLDDWTTGPSAGLPLALVVIELRRPDAIAALLGRPSAKAVDSEIARRIGATLRPQDRFARLTAEHIAVVLPRITEAGLAALAANRLLRGLDAPFELERGPMLKRRPMRLRLRPCAGCAMSGQEQPIAVDRLLAAAQAACANARSNADRFVLAPALHGRAEDIGRELESLQSPLRSNELEIWLQPQLDVATGRCLAAEALLRWRKERDDRFASPMRLVQLAEDSGLMSELTTFVLNTALRQGADLRRMGIDLRVAVNVSATSLHDDEFPDVVARALATWSVPPDKLTIEVTESVMMADMEAALRVMRDIAQLDVRLSIDDFGTGYSSLAQLRQMPLDELKIDRTFVQNIGHNEADVQIVRSVIELAHNFGLGAVAEGAEDQGTCDRLKQLGCDTIQGYHYARPMPWGAIPEWWSATR